MSRAIDGFFVALVLLTAGCSSKVESVPVVPGDGTQTVRLSFNAVASTKAGVGEMDINTLDIFVVNEDIGEIDSYVRVNGVRAELNVRRNANLRIMAFANVRAGAGIFVNELSDFANLYSSLDDTPELGFAMAGECAGSFTRDSSIDLTVSRFASKIRLETLTAAFMDNADAPSSVTLDSVFVINVCRREPFTFIPFADPDSTGWYNRLAQDSSLPDGISRMLGHKEGRTISSSATIACGHTFYVYPNPVDNTVDSFDFPAWSTRNTRLVLRLTIDGKVQYFPISLPAMKSNRQYLVKNLIITVGEGSRIPDIPVSSSRITFELDMHGWDYTSADLDFE